MTRTPQTVRVTCSICGIEFEGKTVKRGENTFLFPRQHHIRYYLNDNKTRFFTTAEICKGSYMKCKEEKENP